MDSISFLQQFHPVGYWMLTAIQVDRKGIETKTFTIDQADLARAWIAERDGKVNLYFNVNQPLAPKDKKAKQEDIAEVGWLHVDIDSRPEAKLEDELKRIRELLDNCPIIPPTVIIYSGGGYQAFWKIREPIPINGDLTIAEDMAQYNKQIELLLGGDNCHNIDRIMRLPGTMNIPNAKKAERGRYPVRSDVYQFNAFVYDIRQFQQAPKLQSPGIQTSESTIQTSNIERLNSVDDLDAWHVPDRVKVIIVQGYHPDEPKQGDNSRSGWLFDVICQLVRAGVPDDTIFSVITDPAFSISGHVLEVEGNADRYAIRQIQRAKDEVEEPWLRELNDKFLVIGNIGGRCRVCEEVMDKAIGRTRLTAQTFSDFQNRYRNHFVSVGKKQVPVGQWWANHNRRRQYDYLVFSPERTEPGAYNLWQGFACKSIPGDKHTSFLEHLHMNVCGGSDIYFHYLLSWMARAVQQPGRPGEVAVVMRGASGVGKSFFAKHFGALWGRHFLQVSNAQHLIGNFNAHLRDCVVLFGDEAFFAGDRKHESVLKTLITEETMVLEQKGMDAEVASNFIHLIIASNHEWVVPTGQTERRFFVLDVKDNHRQDHAYFRAINHDLENGGYENLLHYLLERSLKGFDVRKVPITKALREQKIYSLEGMEQWWLMKLQDGALLPSHCTWEGEVPCQDLVDDYIRVCIQYNIQRRGSDVRLGMFLNKMCPDGYPVRERQTAGRTRRYFYKFPSLAACRQKWDDLQGDFTDWPINEDDVKQGELYSVDPGTPAGV